MNKPTQIVSSHHIISGSYLVSRGALLSATESARPSHPIWPGCAWPSSLLDGSQTRGQLPEQHEDSVSSLHRDSLLESSGQFSFLSDFQGIQFMEM